VRESARPRVTKKNAEQQQQQQQGQQAVRVCALASFSPPLFLPVLRIRRGRLWLGGARRRKGKCGGGVCVCLCAYAATRRKERRKGFEKLEGVGVGRNVCPRQSRRRSFVCWSFSCNCPAAALVRARVFFLPPVSACLPACLRLSVFVVRLPSSFVVDNVLRGWCASPPRGTAAVRQLARIAA